MRIINLFLRIKNFLFSKFIIEHTTLERLPKRSAKTATAKPQKEKPVQKITIPEIVPNTIIVTLKPYEKDGKNLYFLRIQRAIKNALEKSNITITDTLSKRVAEALLSELTARGFLRKKV